MNFQYDIRVTRNFMTQQIFISAYVSDGSLEAIERKIFSKRDDGLQVRVTE